MISFHPPHIDPVYNVQLNLLDQSSLQKGRIYFITVQQDVLTELVIKTISEQASDRSVIQKEKRNFYDVEINIYSLPERYRAHCIAVAMGLGLYCKPRPQTLSGLQGGICMHESQNILTVRAYDTIPEGSPPGSYGVNAIFY